MGDISRAIAAIRRVIIWGHPLHSHTHSYIHEGYARGFRSLGLQTIWTDDVCVLDGIDLRGSLFLSEGQVMTGLPLRRDCLYVLHNAEGQLYEEVAERVLALQVVTNEVRDRGSSGDGVERVNEYTYVEVSDGVPHLYQPWATDLLPEDFDFDVSFPAPWPKGTIRSRLRGLRSGPFRAVWIGTIGGGVYGNEAELAPFQEACARAGVVFVHRQGLGRADHIRLVRNSLMAPAIVGAWQLQNGYLPCRVFKNISYGRIGITNSPSVQAIFDEPVLCRRDTAELFWSASPLVRDRGALVAQMKEVQSRHTYLNRIQSVLEYLP